MLSDKDLSNINGGAIKWTLGLMIGSLVTLIAGIIDGYLRPLKCN
jgi:lactobin A/cerein 7B family class IIb bacteriocin